jgi:hypothetical protein
MSCCSHGKDQKKNVERKSNEENIEEIRHGHHEGSRSDKTNDLVNPRRFGDESTNAVKNAKQGTEERTH